MARKRKSAAQRLLEGRSPGRDSGGRLVLVGPAESRQRVGDLAPRSTHEVTPPPMPRAWPLSPDEKKVWRRISRRLQSSPTQERMASYCRAVVAQQQASAQLSAGATVPEGTQARLAKEIRQFEDEYLTAPAPEATWSPNGHDPFPFAPEGAGPNPFAVAPEGAGRRRKTPSLIKRNPPWPLPKSYARTRAHLKIRAITRCG